MNTSHRYTVERHTHGWLLKAPESQSGIPMDALTEVTPLVSKKAIMHPGIAHALRGIVAIGDRAACAQWAQEITDDLEQRQIPKELKWLRGVNTGMSSLTIFMALADARHHGEAQRGKQREFEGHLPCDADDFSRCSRLVNYMGWRDRLHQVSEKFPAWLRLIENWDELENRFQRADNSGLSERIKELTQ